MRSLKVEYRLTVEDWIAANQYHVAHPQKPPVRPNTGMGTWAIYLLLVLAIGILYLAPQTHKFVTKVLFPGLVGMVVLAALLLFFLLVFRKQLIARSARRMLATGKNAAKMLGRQTLEISPDGVSSTTDYSSGAVCWEGIEKVVATDQHLLIYSTTVNLYVVPKSAFANEWEFTEFAETAKRYHEAAEGSLLPEPGP